MNSNEIILLQKFKNGDIAAIEQIFKTYNNKLYVLARRIIKDDFQAREAVMDIFLKFWNQRKTILIQKSIEAYLVTSIKNQCLNYLRSQKNALKYYSETDLQLFEFEFKYYQDDQVIEKMFTEKLEEEINNAIQKLPQKQLEIFKLSRYNGLSSDEIAGMLSLSKRTVETHIYKALKYLKNHVKKFYSEN